MRAPINPRGRIYILLPGIRTKTGDSRNWAPQMATDINIKCAGAKGDEFRYFTPAIFHRLSLSEHAGLVSDLARRYWLAGYEPVIAAHSDGCEIARRAIILGPAIYRAAHFFSPACEKDFAKNGLNQALLGGLVEKINLHISKGDEVLNVLARWSRFSPFSFGTLGYDGPANVDPALSERVIIDTRQSYAHGDWFLGANWDETFDTITQLENI